ncbi:MAG: LolA family protein [Pyrinomonadaceae bacterium]
MSKFIKNMIAVAVVAFVMAGVSVTQTHAQGIVSDILQRMDAQNKSLSSLRANVRMAKVNAQLGDDADITEGTAIYLPRKGKDALVRIDWRKPDESFAVVDKQYVIYRPRLATAYTGSTTKATGNAKASSALAFMNMSKVQLKQNYSISYIGEETVAGGTKTWHLQLTPKVAATYKSADIWVDSNGFPMQTKIVENNNDSTTVLLSSLEKNVTLNGNLFKIVLPNGTKIQKT